MRVVLAATAVLFLSAMLRAEGGSAYVRAGADGKSWTIGNDLVEREVAINEGFFPLGAWQQPGAATWDGFARLSRQGEGLIAIFRNDATLDRIEAKLPVFPDGAFRMRSVMTGESLGAISGEQFRRGVNVKLPEKYKVEILEVRRSGAL